MAAAGAGDRAALADAAFKARARRPRGGAPSRSVFGRPPRQPGGVHPLKRGKHDDVLTAAELGEPLVDVTLRPGECLFVPAGFAHATSTACCDTGGGTAGGRGRRRGFDGWVLGLERGGGVLLRHGAEINERNGRHCVTALMAAAGNGQKEAVDTLIRHGAAIDLQVNTGDTALSWAAFYGHPAGAQLLLKKGDYGHT